MDSDSVDDVGASNLEWLLLVAVFDASEDKTPLISLSGSTDVSKRSDGKRVKIFVLEADLTVRSGTISSELIEPFLQAKRHLLEVESC